MFGPNGTVRFFSAISVDDSIRKTSIIYSSEEALEALHGDVQPKMALPPGGAVQGMY